jgi:GMP synthase (glutamine-hydrolysing)
MGTVELTISHGDPVIGEPGTLQVNSTHVDSVVELPPGAQLLGSTALDPHAAVRFGPSAWGVQFHPEIDAEVMRHYLAARRSALVSERFDVAALEGGVRDAPGGAAMIGRFLQVARGKPG